jgi:hypothetical protein
MMIIAEKTGELSTTKEASIIKARHVNEFSIQKVEGSLQADLIAQILL